jgi:tetratricopeptide (TPR) repeat protein
MIKSCKCLTAYAATPSAALGPRSPLRLAAAFLLLLILAACSRDPKVQAQRYVDNANKFFAKGKFKEASILYRRALQKDLRFGEAYYRLGLTDLKLGAYGDAAHMLQRAVDLQPTNADAATKLADLYMLAAAQDAQHSADYQKEVNELAAHLIDKALDPYDGHRFYGQLALVKKDPAGAVKEFALAERVKPLQSDLALAYFEALAENNQLADAENLGRKFVDENKSFGPMYDLMYLHFARANRLADAQEVLQLKSSNNPAVPNYILQLAAHYFITKQRPEMDALMQRLSDEKQFPSGHLLAGDFYYFRLREFELARQQYEAGLKAFPKDKATYQKRMVELYANTGRPGDANQLVAAILKDNPKDSDAIAMRAALMLSTGDRRQISQAAIDLQGLVTKNPENHLLRFNLARALIAKGDIEQGRIQLEQAVRLRSDFLVARELLGRVYLMRGDTGKALQESDEIVKLDKNNLQAHLIRSSALLTIHDAGEARKELEYITRTYPNNSDARYQVGYLAWQDKDYKRAEQIFGDLHKANPKDFRGLVGIVETLASQGHLPEAVTQMEAAVAAEPARLDLQLALGNLYVRTERYNDAVKTFQSLLDKEPASADVMFRLAETERRKGELNTSIDLFRKCNQAAPNNTICALQLGLLLDGVGRRDQAKPVYEQILKVNPDEPVALNNLAFIKAEEGGDLDQALTMAQRARQKVPTSNEIADTLGWIYIKKNLSEDAVRVFSDLVEKSPRDYHFHYHYGMALLQKGDRISARKELQMALDNHPSRDDENKIRDLLQKN